MKISDIIKEMRKVFKESLSDDDYFSFAKEIQDVIDEKTPMKPIVQTFAYDPNSVLIQFTFLH